MQTSLFDKGKNEAESVILPDGTKLDYYASAFKTYADDWFLRLKKEIPWQQPAINMAGKKIPIPRLQAWFGDKDAGYQYSGMDLKPLPWSETLLAIKQQVESTDGNHYNSALVNCYRDGRDSVGWHADDEPEIDPSAPIASLSLGVTRLFRLKKKKRELHAKPIKIALHHGDLLVMPPKLQTSWLHEIPKSVHISAMRISITFRKIRE